MQHFDPYALPAGKHFEADARYPDQVYIVSHHRGVPVVSEYDRTDHETETEHSFRLDDIIHEAALGMDFNDLLDMLDELLDTGEESYEEANAEHRVP